MRNRFMIYRKGHSVASALLFVLLIAHLLLPLLAWLGSAAGFPLGNLFSSEGIDGIIFIFKIVTVLRS